MCRRWSELKVQWVAIVLAWLQHRCSARGWGEEVAIAGCLSGEKRKSYAKPLGRLHRGEPRLQSSLCDLRERQQMLGCLALCVLLCCFAGRI